MRLRFPDFSRPEMRTAALLFAYNFLIMSAFTVIKPVRSALLLERRFESIEALLKLDPGHGYPNRPVT